MEGGSADPLNTFSVADALLSAYFHCISLYTPLTSPHNNTCVRCDYLPFCRRGNGGSERLSNMPRASAGIQIQLCLPRSLLRGPKKSGSPLWHIRCGCTGATPGLEALVGHVCRLPAEQGLGFLVSPPHSLGCHFHPCFPLH